MKFLPEGERDVFKGTHTESESGEVFLVIRTNCLFKIKKKTIFC